MEINIYGLKDAEVERFDGSESVKLTMRQPRGNDIIIWFDMPDFDMIMEAASNANKKSCKSS